MFIQKNLLFSFLNFILTLGLKFGVRLVFVRTLTLEYLGLNSLFTELLAMLSVMELGLGPSIVYSLYKPLACQDRQQTTALMQLFRKVYHAVGAAILLLGLLLYPWLEFFVKAVPAVADWKLFYLLFLLNTALSYLWCYQRNLLIADQKQYVVNVYDSCVQIGVALLQLITLLSAQSYWLYLLVMLAGTIMENILLDRKAKQDYPLLSEQIALRSATKLEIVKNLKAMLVHKLATVLVLSSTNLILAKLLGLAAVGLCSNYLLITNALSTLGGRLMGSLTATVGHKLVLEEQTANQRLFAKMHFATCALASLCFVGLSTLLNPFVELWLGQEYLLPDTTVALLVFYFYLHFLRRVPLLFRDAAGLYHQDRLKAVVELLLNVSLSWFLVQRYGIAGVFIAGIISTLCTCIWAEPYIVFKYTLGLSLKTYLLQFLGCTAVTVLCALGWKYACLAFLDPTLSLWGFVSVGLAITLSMGIVWWLVWRFKFALCLWKMM